MLWMVPAGKRLNGVDALSLRAIARLIVCLELTFLESVVNICKQPRLPFHILAQIVSRRVV